MLKFTNARLWTSNCLFHHQKRETKEKAIRENGCQGKIESHGTDTNNEFCHWKPRTLLYKLQSHHSIRWGIKCASSSTRHQGRGSAAWLWIPQVFQEHALIPFIHLCTQEVFRQWLQSRGGSLAPQPHYFTSVFLNFPISCHRPTLLWSQEVKGQGNDHQPSSFSQYSKIVLSFHRPVCLTPNYSLRHFQQ